MRIKKKNKYSKQTLRYLFYGLLMLPSGHFRRLRCNKHDSNSHHTQTHFVSIPQRVCPLVLQKTNF